MRKHFDGKVEISIDDFNALVDIRDKVFIDNNCVYVNWRYKGMQDTYHFYNTDEAVKKIAEINHQLESEIEELKTYIHLQEKAYKSWWKRVFGKK